MAEQRTSKAFRQAILTVVLTWQQNPPSEIRLLDTDQAAEKRGFSTAWLDVAPWAQHQFVPAIAARWADLPNVVEIEWAQSNRTSELLVVGSSHLQCGANVKQLRPLCDHKGRHDQLSYRNVTRSALS